MSCACARWFTAKVSSYPSAEALWVSTTETPAFATIARSGRTAPTSSRSLTLCAASRTSASRARSQPISCTVAPAARAASATSVSALPGRPTSSKSGRCAAGRLAIANVAALPRPPVGPVSNTVPDAIEFMFLLRRYLATILRRTPVIRQSSGFPRTASARTNPFPDRPRSAQWRNGLVGVRSDVAALARPRPARRSGRPRRRAPPRGGAAPRRAGRTGRDLGGLPDQARTRTGHLTVGTGRGGARARVACLRRRARPALPIGRARDSWTRRRIVADHTERATPARSPGEHTRRRLRRNVDPHGRQRALRRPDGSDDKLAGNRT